MTLIAAVHEQGVPVLIGDLLVTGPPPRRRSQVSKAPIPTRGDLSQLLPKGVVVRGLQRKLVRLSDTLAIGVAGVTDAILELLGGMRVHFLGFKGEPAEVFQWLERYDKKIDADVELVGSVVFSGHSTLFRWRSRTRKVESGSDVYAVGSGESQFERELQDGYVERTGTADGAIRAVQRALAICTELVANECIDGRTLRSRVGGGFESLCFDGKQFSFVSDIAYFVWLVSTVVGKDTSVRPRPFFFVYHYEDDVLWIERRDFRLPSPETMEIWRTEHYGILPIWRTTPTTEPAVRQSFSSPVWYGNFYASPARGDPRKTLILSIVNRDGLGEGIVRVETDGTKPSGFGVNRAFLKELHIMLGSEFLQIDPERFAEIVDLCRRDPAATEKDRPLLRDVLTRMGRRTLSRAEGNPSQIDLADSAIAAYEAVVLLAPSSPTLAAIEQELSRARQLRASGAPVEQ